MLLAIVDGVGRVVDRDALEGIGVLGVKDNGLSGNGQGAIDVRDVVVVNLRGLARGGDKRVLARAGSSLGAGDLICQGFPCHEALTAGDCNVRLLVLGQRNAIVDLGAVGGGKGDGALGNGQLVVDDHELDIGEVGVRVGEVRGLQLHLVSARVDTAHGGVAGEGEVGLRVQRIGGHKVVALGRLLGAVVRIGAAALSDGDGDLAGGGRHLEGALVLGDLVVVGLESRELGVGDGVGHLAIGHVSHGAGGAHVGDLAVDEALVAGLLPAADLGQAVGLAVVGPGVGAGSEHHLALEDLVGHPGRAVVVALAGDGHGHGAGVGEVLAVGEVVVDALDQLGVAVLDGGLLRLLGAVVHDVGQGAHGHAVAGLGGYALGGDRQGAVFDDELNIGKVSTGVGELPGVETHGVGALSGALRHSLTSKGKVALLVQGIGDGRDSVAGHRLLGAVVGLSLAVARDGNGDLVSDGRHLKGALVLGDGVVLSLRVAVQRVGEGVGGAARNSLGAREGVRSTFALGPTVTGNLDRSGAVDKCSAVVLLGKVDRLESDGALSNSKRAIGHIKTNAGAGEVIRNAVRKCEARAGKAHFVGAGINAGRPGSHVGAQDNLILSNQFGADGLNRKALNGLLTAAIRLGVRGALDLNDNLISVGGDEKAAILGLSNNVLARGINRANRTLGKRCCIGTNVRTSSTYGDGLEISTLGRAGKARHALLGAVVRLGVGIRGQGHVLVVVDVDNAGTIALDRDGRILAGHHGVAVNSLGAISRADNATPRSRLRAGIGDLGFGTVEVVVDRVVDGILLIQEDNGVVALANRMRVFGRAISDQMVAINRLGRFSAVLAQLAIVRVSRGKLFIRAVLQILHLVRNERLPHGRKSHVVGRHGEGGATCKSSDIIQARNGPTSELIILTRRLMPHGLSRALRSRVHGSVGATPSATLELINNLITANVLGIEVRGVIHHIRECHRLRKGLIEIPARERIGNAVYVLGSRKIASVYVRRLYLVTLHIVLRSQLGELSAARIAQVVLDKHNILALDGNIAVKVLVGSIVVVLGDFRGNKRNLFDIILGNFNTRKLGLNDRLVVLVNLVPGSRVLGHHIGAIRPRNHTLVNVVKAVLIIGPRRTSNIDGCNAVLGTPIARIVGVCVLRRVKQIVHAGLVRRLSDGLDRDVLRRNHRRAISIGKREAHRCGALAKARHQTALIDGQDSFVRRRPGSGTDGIGGIGHSRQLKRGELSYRALTRNRDARG